MKKNILLYLLPLALLSSCNDKMFSKSKEVITTPGVGAQPTTSPVKFSGIKNISEVTDSSVKLTWDHSHGAATYTIVLNNRVHSVVMAPTSEVTLDGLTPETAYNVRVRLMDEMTLIDDQFDNHSFTTLESTFLANDIATQFRGTQYVELKNSNEMFKHPQHFSMSLWFKTGHEHRGSDARLFTIHKGTQASSALSIGVENSKLFLLASDSLNNETKMAFSSVNDNQWHHLVVTYQVDKLSLYLDGTKLTEQNIVLSSFGTHKVQLASYTGWQKGFTGLLDDVSFWDEALSNSSVDTLFDSRAKNNLKKMPNLAMWLRMGDHFADSAAQLVDELSFENFNAFGLTNADFLSDAP